MTDRFTFTAPLWRWTARRESDDTGAWCFVTLPPDVVDEVRQRSAEPARASARCEVHVEVGETTWDTSIFPDSASEGFVLPVKKAVRTAAGVGEGDELTVHLR